MRRPPNKHRSNGLVLVGVLVGGSPLVPGCHKAASTTTEAKPPPHVRAAPVVLIEPRPNSRHLVALEAARRARLAPRAGGQVVSIAVDEQAEVTEGATLVQFAGADSRGGLISAQAARERVKESLRDNERELKTARGLLAKGVETSRRVEELETQRATLLAQLREAKGQIVQARDRVGATAIVAPFAGTVTSIDTEIGEYMGPGTVAMVLAQLDPMAVEVPLTQSEVVLYDNGGLDFTIKTQTGPVSPKLEWIANEADPTTSTFAARLLVPNDHRKLRAGQLVDVEVFGQAQGKVKAVPSTAVRWAADESYVLRLDGDEVARVDVTVVDESETMVVIEGSIAVGERVVQSGPTALLTGDKVHVVSAPSEAETLASQ